MNSNGCVKQKNQIRPAGIVGVSLENLNVFVAVVGSLSHSVALSFFLNYRRVPDSQSETPEDCHWPRIGQL